VAPIFLFICVELLINKTLTNKKESAMKKLFVALFALLLSFFFACQEGNITDPANDNVDNQSNKDYLTYINSEVIELEGSTYDPVHKSDDKGTAEVRGKITYEHKLVFVDPIAPSPQNYVLLNVRVDADIIVQCPKGEKTWTVDKYFQDVVYIPQVNEVEVFIEKRLVIPNACCHPADLLFKFKVTEKSIEVHSMWLEKSTADFIIDVE
jgi:hypothetical protein